MAPIYYQLKVGHAIIGTHLKRVEKADDGKFWWGSREAVQSREHLVKHSKHSRKPPEWTLESRKTGIWAREKAHINERSL
jgi:hypothetical protein